MKQTFILKISPVLFLIVLLSACKKELQPDSSPPLTETMSSSASRHADFTVVSGTSIQAAVDAAAPGSTIEIQPGVYNEAVIVNKPNIKLVGLSNGQNSVVIQNPGTVNNGITVRSDGDGFELYNVTIQNFEANGVVMIRADNFKLSHVTVIDCGEYGLWPIRSNNGVIEHCIASGHTDSGIYTGQSDNIVLKFNDVFHNTIGLEIENCSNVIATNNQCHGNVAGLLAVLLPGLPTTTSSDITINNNHVYQNNKVNTVDPSEGFEAFVPSGVGILIVGTDNTTVLGNKVQGNTFLGIAVVSSVVLGALAGLPPEAFALIEPNPDGTTVKNNIVNTNGTVQPTLPFPAVDLLWDGSGTNNCWLNNNFRSSFPYPLPACN